MEFSGPKKSRLVLKGIERNERQDHVSKILTESCGMLFNGKLEGPELLQELARATELPREIIEPEISDIIQLLEPIVDEKEALCQMADLREAMLRYLEEIHLSMEAEFLDAERIIVDTPVSS